MPATLLLLALPITASAQTPRLTEHPVIVDLFKSSNKIRTDNKLTAHRLSEDLTRAAQDHAWYMARMHDRGTEDFEHRGGNGTPGQRAARFGYEGTVKENIARGYDSVGQAFAAWLKSPTHSDTDDAGFGYAQAKDGTTYWVGVYGKPTPSWNLINPRPGSSAKP